MKPTLTTIFLLLFSCPALAAELRGVVERVVDGDTLDLCSNQGELERVRLSGVDAPERGQPFYKEARDSLSALVSEKAVVVVWSKKDRYKRMLGTVLVGSVNVNLELTRRGFAWFFKRYATDVLEIERIQYEAAEIEAREGKCGLWRTEKPVSPWEWRNRKRLDRDRSITVKARRVTTGTAARESDLRVRAGR